MQKEEQIFSRGKIMEEPEKQPPQKGDALKVGCIIFALLALCVLAAIGSAIGNLMQLNSGGGL